MWHLNLFSRTRVNKKSDDDDDQDPRQGLHTSVEDMQKVCYRLSPTFSLSLEISFNETNGTIAVLLK